MQHCPTAHELNRFLSREMPDGESHRVAEHIDHCGDCQTALEKLSEHNDLLQWRVAAVGTCDRLPIGPSLAIVMEGARHAAATPHWGVAETADDAAPAPLTFLGPARRDGDLGSLGPYLVRAELGRGGMGIVLEAFDTELGRDVAIKVLRPDRADEKSRARFVREAQSAARVKHDHVVTIYSVANPPDALPYLVMELVRGPTLRELIEQGHAIQSGDKSPHSKGRIDPREVARIIAEVADGLSAAHDAGLVHRDVKPSNVLLEDGGRTGTLARLHSTGKSARPTAKLTDFGLARLTSLPPGSTLTHDGTLVGTPTYMSPEQVRNPEALDPRGDVYSLGVTMYEALTGEAPFTGAPHEVLRHIESDEPRSPRRLDGAIPADVETICLKAMSKLPERRYQSARELGGDLRRWLRGEPITARPVGRAERLWRWSRRNPRVAALAGTVLGLLIFLVAGLARFAAARHEAEQNRAAADLAGRRASESSAAADASRQVAEEHFDVALDSLNELIFQLQESLAVRGGTLTVRRELLEAALGGLDRVTKAAAGNPAATHSLVAAHQRIGDILWRTGQPADARSHFQTSLELAGQQSAADTGNVDAWRDLARAHELLGNLSLQAADTVDAATHFQRSLDIRAAQAATHPDRTEIRREVAGSHIRLGNVHMLKNETTAAVTAYAEATRILESLAESNPNDGPLQRELVLSLRRLSSAETRSGNLEAAKQHADQGLARADAILVADPENALIRNERASLYQSLADVAAASGEFDDAIDRYHRALADLEARAAADPENAESQWSVQLVHNQIAGVELTRNNIAGAIASAERQVQILEPLVAKHPGSLKYRNSLLEVLWSLGDYSLRRGDYAAAHDKYRQIAALLTQAEQSGTMQPAIEPYKLLGGLFLAATPLVPRAVVDLNFADSQDAALRPMLLALPAYDFARRGDHASAARVADQLRGNFPAVHGIERGIYYIALARTYSLCLAAVTRDSSGAASTPDSGAAAREIAELRSRYLQSAIACLREASHAFPYFTSGYRTEPDLSAIRATPEFATLLRELEPAK